MKAIRLPLLKKYKTKIYGFGEVYELISVERKRQDLKKKFNQGVLFLAPNKNHSGKGLTLKELVKVVRKQNYQLLDQGFVDSPPWRSFLKKKQRKLPAKGSFLNLLVSLIFKLLVELEFIWQGERTSHMIFVLGRKR